MRTGMTTRCSALVVGASRGIGRQIAIDLAANGYAVAVAAKSVSDAYTVDPFPPDPNSAESTISTVVREIHEAGNEARAFQVDTRDFQSIENMVKLAFDHYGRLDVIIYNSGAIWWAPIADTPHKRFQLMQRVNVEGLYGTIQACLPFFAKQAPLHHARIVVVSPPIYSRFFRGKTAYAVGKVGMSVLTKGLAMDFEREGKRDMAVTSIWPASAIQSAATQSTSKERLQDLRTPQIFSEAILHILKAPVASVNGAIFTDEDFLRDHVGYADADIEKFNLIPGSHPRRIMPKEFPNLRVAEHDEEGVRVNSVKQQREKKSSAKL